MLYLFFGILIFCFILSAIIFIIMLILSFVVKAQRKNTLKQIISEHNIRNYTHSNQFQDHSYLMVDHDTDELWIITDDAIVRASFNDIREVRFDIDDIVAYKTSLASAAGRAIVGGVLFGGLGAVVGGATAKKIGKKIVNQVSLTISLRNCEIPYLRLMLLDDENGISTDDYRYREAEKDGLYWSEYITSKIS